MNCHLIQDKPEKPGCRTGFLNIITHLHTWDFSELIKIGSVNTTLYGILGQQNWVQKLIGFLFLRSHNRAMVTTSSPLRKLEFHSQILSLIKWEILDKLSQLFTILVMKSGFWTIAKKTQVYANLWIVQVPLLIHNLIVLSGKKRTVLSTTKVYWSWNFNFRRNRKENLEDWKWTIWQKWMLIDWILGPIRLWKLVEDMCSMTNVNDWLFYKSLLQWQLLWAHSILHCNWHRDWKISY